MSTDSAQLFFSLLMFVAAGGAIALVVLRVAVALGSESAQRIGRDVGHASTWLAFLVAATATLGSLYFSEVAHFVPCRLCWFQRIAMYPLSLILLVGAIRRDPAVRWYVGPLAAIGAAVAAYHTLIEWRPELDTGACELFGPSCTDVWFKEFGFVTLATMSLVGFLTILLLMFVRFPATLDDDAPSTPDTPLLDPTLEAHS
ncbi:MAG: disulfide bond formation protein B [Ilumatobacteraceae bacterium]